jgi:type VI secretion system protein ImpK
MRLMDCFIELVAYVVYFQKSAGERQPPYNQVKHDIERFIAISQNRATQSKASADDYDQARFAVFAWVDEMVLSSNWSHKNQWQSEQLQRTYFQTTDAGELFFERLNNLGPHQRDVREVYYLCLALGFMGRFCHDGDEYLLDQLQTSNLKLLTGSAVGPPSVSGTLLFSEAYPSATETPMGSDNTRGFFSALTLLGIGFPVVLFGALFFIYRFILNNVGEGFGL